MTEHITQAINAAMQPKPASAEDIKLLVCNLVNAYREDDRSGNSGSLSQLILAGEKLSKAITQQAEALAQARSEVERIKEVEFPQRLGKATQPLIAERDQLRVEVERLELQATVHINEYVQLGYENSQLHVKLSEETEKTNAWVFKYGNLGYENNQLRAEVERLKYEIDAIPAIKEERDRLSAEVEKWKAIHEVNTDTLNAMQVEVEQRNAQLAALQYDGELPEPIASGEYWVCGSCEFPHNNETGFCPECDHNTAKERTLYTADQVRQAIANDLAKQVPQGWKLVPVEPTHEMISAARRGHIDAMQSLARHDADRAAYRALIAAAPDPKEAV